MHASCAEAAGAAARCRLLHWRLRSRLCLRQRPRRRLAGLHVDAERSSVPRAACSSASFTPHGSAWPQWRVATPWTTPRRAEAAGRARSPPGAPRTRPSRLACAAQWLVYWLIFSLVQIAETCLWPALQWCARPRCRAARRAPLAVPAPHRLPARPAGCPVTWRPRPSSSPGW